MINFQLTMPTKIYFGKDSIKKIGKELSSYNRILLLSGSGNLKRIGIYNKVYEEIMKCNVKIFELEGVLPNPDIEKVREGIEICKKNNVDLIIGVGGGSVIDSAKAIAAGFYYDGDPWDLFLDEKKVKNGLPIGAILTLAATGSETNGNSVISNRKTKQKLAIHSDCLRPKFAILDPTYTFSVNKYHTAAGSVDIISHVLEQYFSPTKENFLIDRFSEQIIKTVIKYTKIAINEPENYIARSQLMYSSTLALNGLLSSGKITDWASHAMEHEISATHDVTHGIGLGIIFPKWMRYVLDDERVWKFEEFAQNVFNINDGDKHEKANLAIKMFENFLSEISIPDSLKDLNIDKSYVEIWTENLVQRRKSIGNFKVLFEEDIRNIYNNCF